MITPPQFSKLSTFSESTLVDFTPMSSSALESCIEAYSWATLLQEPSKWCWKDFCACVASPGPPTRKRRMNQHTRRCHGVTRNSPTVALAFPRNRHPTQWHLHSTKLAAAECSGQ